VDLPASLVDHIEHASSAADIRNIGVDFCTAQVAELLAAKVPGVHFYTQGRAEPIAKVVEATFPKKKP
jgi:methylenetetrahydrofolate reductase (NADPH)